MKPFLFQFAPSFAVIMAAVTLFWPYVSPPERPQAEPVKVTTLEPRMLSPKIADVPERNPFGLTTVEAVAPKPADDPYATPKTPAALAAMASAGKAAIAKSADLHKPALPVNPIQDRLSKLSLGAISIHDDKSIAVIDGKIYEKGDAIQGLAFDVGPAILADILPQKIVLRVGTADYAVAFSDTSASRNRPGPSPSMAPAASPSTKRAASRNTPTRNRSR